MVRGNKGIYWLNFRENSWHSMVVAPRYIDGKQGFYPAWYIVAQRVNITIKLTHTHIISLPGISDKTRIVLSLFFHLKYKSLDF